MTPSLPDLYKGLGDLELICIAFFDLVDSTLLKKQLGQSRGVDLAVTHNRVAAAVCQQFRGRVIKHIGDSIMAVFPTPLEGALAALEFIGTIHRDKLPFRTKAGLTHGTVTRVAISGDDYLGQAVDRSARLTGLALPNQALTDEVTMDIIRPFLGDFEEIISRFLGMQELKGIGKVPIYEIALASPGFVSEDKAVPEVNLESARPVTGKTAPPPPAGSRMQLPPLADPKPPGCTVDKPLDEVLEACTPSRTDLDSVAIGFQNLNHVLEKAYELNIRQVSFSGSFSRGTMIRPVGPVDVVTVMAPAPSQQPGVEESLVRLERCLSQGFPKSDSSRSYHHVEITLEGIKFTVIPLLAVVEKGQGRLMIPSFSGGFWVNRNPAAPERWMEKAVERNGTAFLPFLRLVRAWQKTNCNYMNSFHLEMLTDLIASKFRLDLSLESVYQWFWHTYQFFSQNKKPYFKDPDQKNTYVDDYMYRNSLTFNRFSRILTESCNLAKQGIAYHRAGEPNVAAARWKALFRSYLED